VKNSAGADRTNAIVGPAYDDTPPQDSADLGVKREVDRGISSGTHAMAFERAESLEASLKSAGFALEARRVTDGASVRALRRVVRRGELMQTGVAR
jgi:hypothetical protein